MDTDRACEELRVIRALMERPVRYSTMSGLAGIVAGCVALAGLGADWLVCCRHGPDSGAMWLNFAIWLVVLGLAVAGVLGLTRFRELRRGMPFWSPIKRKILLTICPPFVAGAGLSVAIIARAYAGLGTEQLGLIPAIWMGCYGLACWQVGEHSIRELRVLGVAFILAAVASAAAFQLPAGQGQVMSPYWTLGVTFGGFHIVYGIVVWARHGG